MSSRTFTADGRAARVAAARGFLFQMKMEAKKNGPCRAWTHTTQTHKRLQIQASTLRTDRRTDICFLTTQPAYALGQLYSKYYDYNLVGYIFFTPFQSQERSIGHEIRGVALPGFPGARKKLF